jgi:hypothetical protein
MRYRLAWCRSADSAQRIKSVHWPQNISRRTAKRYVHEIFSGLDYTHFPQVSLIGNKLGANATAKLRDIDPSLTCAFALSS